MSVIVCFEDGTKEVFQNVDEWEIDHEQNILFLTVNRRRIMFNWAHVRYIANKESLFDGE